VRKYSTQAREQGRVDTAPSTNTVSVNTQRQ
jgi:hypothetical protein